VAEVIIGLERFLDSLAAVANLHLDTGCRAYPVHDTELRRWDVVVIIPVVITVATAVNTADVGAIVVRGASTSRPIFRLLEGLGLGNVGRQKVPQRQKSHPMRRKVAVPAVEPVQGSQGCFGVGGCNGGSRWRRRRGSALLCRGTVQW
jgi:hypothetical protein